eukprot:TRINITY_DN7709_c0_g3_i6.p1 TRINITY_DN7709_c0_g3~~TRINITY_DN7709_c0_g3_i6.p1  ORF type:complete len:494 (-),score=117.19 TRINITY_DN7709_c0_g3_i6:58-1317(-)
MSKMVSIDDAGFPDTLKDEIHKFKLEGYAEEHFRVFKKRVGVFMRKVPVEDMLTFQTEPLTGSLLRASSNADSQTAVKVFTNICKFIGVSESSKTPALTAKAVVEVGVEKAGLRDEIYCQLCKQSRKNPNLRSVAACWKLIALCACNFAPTRGFEGYVLSYMSQAARETVNTTTEILTLIVFSVWRLNRTIRSGPMKGGTGSLSLEDIDRVATEGIPYQFITFGSTVSFILKCQENNGVETDEVPFVLPTLISKCRDLGALQTEGIFRRTGDRSEIERAINEIEKGRLEELKCDDPLVIADVIKIWFREMCPHIFPAAFSRGAEKLGSSSSTPAQCFAYLDHLPSENRSTVMTLLGFCAEIVNASARTSMGAENLGIVFGPNMFTDEEGDRVDPTALFTGSNARNVYFANLIRAYVGSS